MPDGRRHEFFGQSSVFGRPHPVDQQPGAQSNQYQQNAIGVLFLKECLKPGNSKAAAADLTKMVSMPCSILVEQFLADQIKLEFFDQVYQGVETQCCGVQYSVFMGTLDAAE